MSFPNQYKYIDTQAIMDLTTQISVVDTHIIIEKFMNESYEKIKKIREALKNKNIQSIQSSVHDLKTTALILGAEELSDFATYIEKRALEGNVHEREIEGLAELVDLSCKDLKQILEQNS